MTKLVPNEPVRTRAARITIDGDLPIGRHTFRLVVIDNDGNRSEPDEVVVSIVRGIIDPFPGPIDPRPIPIDPRPRPIDPRVPSIDLDPRLPPTPIDPRLPPIDVNRPRSLPTEGDEQ